MLFSFLQRGEIFIAFFLVFYSYTFNENAVFTNFLFPFFFFDFSASFFFFLFFFSANVPLFIVSPPFFFCCC